MGVALIVFYVRNFLCGNNELLSNKDFEQISFYFLYNTTFNFLLKFTFQE